MGRPNRCPRNNPRMGRPNRCPRNPRMGRPNRCPRNPRMGRPNRCPRNPRMGRPNRCPRNRCPRMGRPNRGIRGWVVRIDVRGIDVRGIRGWVVRIDVRGWVVRGSSEESWMGRPNRCPRNNPRWFSVGGKGLKRHAPDQRRRHAPIDEWYATTGQFAFEGPEECQTTALNAIDGTR